MTGGLSWGVVEPAVAIMVACAPTYRPFLEGVGVTAFIESISLRSLLSRRKRSATQTKTDEPIDISGDASSQTWHRPRGTYSREAVGRSASSSKGDKTNGDEIEMRKDVLVYEESGTAERH